jgi:protein-disulfide isomerase
MTTARHNLVIAVLILAGGFVLALFGATLLPPKQDKSATAPAPTAKEQIEPTVDFADPVRGPADAPITVVAFGDYLCAPCADADRELAAVLAEMPSEVRVVWKDLPNEPAHAGATQAAVAARCAGDQGAFWQYHDLLMDQQSGLVAASYVPIAAELGLDVDQFQSCLEGEATRPLVERTVDEALRLKIDATPYFFVMPTGVPGKARRASGALTADQFRGFIEAAKADAAEKPPATGDGQP